MMAENAMEMGNAAALCRDCGYRGPAGVHCPQCAGPRLVRHPELFGLSIGHVDCDAFYAAVEKRDNPELRDKPLIIGGGRRGVVSTACYIARINGVRSAMPMFKALKACPDAVVMRPDMEKYVKVGREVRQMMLDLTPLVEPLSIDEAFVDLSGTEKLHGRPPAASLAGFARRVEDEIGITVSIGLSYNKFLAKVGSDQDKPRGFFVIGKAEALGFLRRQSIGLIWGVGKSLQAKLRKDGIATIGDLQKASREKLNARYGSIGDRLFYLSRGEDERTVKPDREAKSVSSETTFSGDIADFDALNAILWTLSEKVSARLKTQGITGRTVTMKLKDQAFRTKTRSHTLPAPTQMARAIHDAGRALLQPEADGTRYRLIGIGVSGLESDADHDPARDLFGEGESAEDAAERAVDAVRRKFGRNVIGRGIGFKGPQDKAARR